MDTLLTISNFAVIIILGFFLKNYIPSYFGEKGKNLATKDDIGEITDTIEKIRAEYAKELKLSGSKTIFLLNNQNYAIN